MQQSGQRCTQTDFRLLFFGGEFESRLLHYHCPAAPGHPAERAPCHVITTPEPFFCHGFFTTLMDSKKRSFFMNCCVCMRGSVLAPANRIAARTVQSNVVPSAIHRLHAAAINLTNALHRFIGVFCARGAHKIGPRGSLAASRSRH